VPCGFLCRSFLKECLDYDTEILPSSREGSKRDKKQKRIILNGKTLSVLVQYLCLTVLEYETCAIETLARDASHYTSARTGPTPCHLHP